MSTGSTGSTASRLEELAALIAIGAATADEHAEFEQLASNNPGAAAEFAQWQATASALAEALEPASVPAGGLEALQAAISTDSASTSTEPASSQKQTILGAPAPDVLTTPEYAEERSNQRDPVPADVINLDERRRKRFLGVGLVASLAAAAAILFLFLSERSRASGLERDLQAVRDARDSELEAVRKDAQVEIDKLAAELENSSQRVQTLAARFEPLRGAKLEHTAMSSEGGGFANVFADEDGKKWLIVAGSMPALTAEQDYQMWFVPSDGKPVSAGLLRAGPDGVLSATMEVPSELAKTRLRPAISLEPRGGSTQPTEVKLIGEPI